MYTEQERKVAKNLLENKEALELIAKIFLETEDKINSDLVFTKTNEELGEIVRANDLAEQKVKTRFNILKNLGQKQTGTPKPAAVA